MITPLRGVSDAAFEAAKKLVNHEAEQALLGALLLNNRAYDAVCDVLAGEDFAHPLHGRIYSAIATFVAGGSEANAVTLHGYFADDADASFGGNPAGYLAQLDRCAVSVLNSYHYARNIRDLARRRRLVEAAQQIMDDAAAPDPERDADAVLDDAEQLLHDIAEPLATTGPQPLSAIMPRTLEAVEAAYKRAADGGSGALVIDTGLAALDGIMRGMGAGDVKLLAAAGAFLGPFGVLYAALFSLFAGGAGAIAFVAWRALRASISTIVHDGIGSAGASAFVAVRLARRERLPFALPIAVGGAAACAYLAGVTGTSGWLQGAFL